MSIRVTSSRSWPKYVSGARGFEEPFIERTDLWVPFVLAAGGVRDFPFERVFEVPFDAPAVSLSANIVSSARRRLAAGCEVDVLREAEASEDPISGTRESSTASEARLRLPNTCLGAESVGARGGSWGLAVGGSDVCWESWVSKSFGLGAERTVLEGS